MIAIDSSSLIAYLAGGEGDDVEVVDAVLADRSAVLPPVVLSELLSEPRLGEELVTVLLALPLLPPTAGYWERAGRLRASLLARRRKAPLADSLIAQSCLDHQVPLVTRDGDFRHFVRSGLKLLP